MRFVFVMQHQPTIEQLESAGKIGDIVQLEDKKLLNVPDDPALGRDFFVKRAEEIEVALGGFSSDDTVQAMGQQQLATAINARAKKTGAVLVESVTARESVEVTQPDGSVKKENIFRFKGFRPMYEF